MALPKSYGIALGWPAAGGQPSSFNPYMLGPSILGWWDARAVVPLPSGKVSAWVDLISGHTIPQATDANRPTLGNGIAGQPALEFNGIDQFLSAESVFNFPIGSDPCEIWVVARQDALAADTETRVAFAYGGGGNQISRSVRRNSANLPAVVAGNGVSSASSVGSSEFTGARVIRGSIGSSRFFVAMDGVAAVPTESTPGTTAVRTRVGATSAGSATNPFQGAISAIIVTAPLTDTQSRELATYLRVRAGL